MRYEEIVGYHLERAYRYREELGPVDEATAALARSAAERLGRAGERALARGDTAATANLLGRAVGLLPHSDPARAGLLVPLGMAFRFNGDLERAAQTLSEAVELGEASGDQRVRAHAAVEHMRVRALLGGLIADEMRAEAEEARRVLERLSARR